MKKLFDKISSNDRQIVEIIALVVVTSIPYMFDLQVIFKDYLSEHPLSPDHFFWQLAIMNGRIIAAIIIFVAALIVIRKINKDFLMNRKHIYHDYNYAWYWFCAKILGIRKCNLVLVPIYMQFKLVIRGTFEEYPLEESDYPYVDNEPECRVSIINPDIESSEKNMIIEDTYKIEIRQIPESKQGLRTIIVNRNDGMDHGRHFSPKLIETVINNTRSIENNSVINIFATTNPLNTKHIASRAFGLGERGNVEHLYVFQQRKDDNRYFELDGHQIY